MGTNGADGGVNAALHAVTFISGIVVNSDDRFVILCVREDGPRDGGGGRGSGVSVAFPEVAERIAQSRRHQGRYFATEGMVDVGRREGAAGGGDRRGIVNVEGLALVTAVSATILHVRDERGSRDECPPVVRELPRAREADLLEHGDQGDMAREEGRGDVVGRRRRDVAERNGGGLELKYGDGHRRDGKFTNWSKLEEEMTQRGQDQGHVTCDGQETGRLR